MSSRDVDRPAVRAVIFDWGGTLTPWHEVDLPRQWHEFARAWHLGNGHEAWGEHAGARDLAARLLSAEEAAWSRGRTDHSSAALRAILDEVGMVPDHHHHDLALAAYQRFWEPHTFTDPLVRPLWEGLKQRGLKVGVLSNTIWTRDYHRAIFDRDGVLDLLDGDVYSSEIEYVKPHAEAFLAAASAVNVDAVEAVYVGDRLFEDVFGPQQVGMRAVWIPHSVIPASQHVPTVAVPDATAASLLDILEIVDAWRT